LRCTPYQADKVPLYVYLEIECLLTTKKVELSYMKTDLQIEKGRVFYSAATNLMFNAFQ